MHLHGIRQVVIDGQRISVDATPCWFPNGRVAIAFEGNPGRWAFHRHNLLPRGRRHEDDAEYGHDRPLTGPCDCWLTCRIRSNRGGKQHIAAFNIWRIAMRGTRISMIALAAAMTLGLGSAAHGESLVLKRDTGVKPVLAAAPSAGSTAAP
jgi:hypothetical protein